MPPRRSAPWLVATTLVVALAAAGCAREPRAPEQAPLRLTPGAPDTVPAPVAPAATARARPAAPAQPAVAAVSRTDVTAWSSPARQRMVGLFPARQASRERTTFLVAQPPGAAGAAAKAAGWLRVMLPRRPNGSTGWIRRDQVDLVPLRNRVEVDLSSRQLTLFELDRVVRRWPVAIGRPATPTPTGRFYVTVKLKPPAISRVYGAFALGLSGYSNVLDQFGTGDGQIALHGTANTGSIGRAVSHGCVRLDNQAITRLAAELPLGTPVTIKG
jgi:lipoprotein-anchoring transpeptidase ErfK/SrfK